MKPFVFVVVYVTLIVHVLQNSAHDLFVALFGRPNKIVVGNLLGYPTHREIAGLFDRKSSENPY